MKKKLQIPAIILAILVLVINTIAGQQQRFPKPEFESGYEVPATQISKVQPAFFDYLDLAVFIGAMSLITWLILKKRSRRGVFWVSIFSLLYFGFYRKGCICPVGSLQNITLALFNQDYSIPFTAIAFFAIPLGFTLFYGRTFCAGVCPLGAIQDIFALRPVSLKPWIRYVLGIIPYLYLGLAILFAATGTDFIICRYDPFVGFFRHNGSFMMFALGGILLVSGIFIARPYCRFLCPYGVLLNLVSRVSKRHLTITPAECIKCRLCENSCPFDAIDKPTGQNVKSDNRELVKKLTVYFLITPLLVVLSGWTMSRYHEDFAMVNFKVRLANEIINQGNESTEALSDEVTAFMSSGTTTDALYSEVLSIIGRFKTGSWIIGSFIGLVLGLTLARLTIYKYRNEYVANKGNCFSCARCLDYCPVKAPGVATTVALKFDK